MRSAAAINPVLAALLHNASSIAVVANSALADQPHANTRVDRSGYPCNAGNSSNESLATRLTLPFREELNRMQDLGRQLAVNHIKIARETLTHAVNAP